MASLINLELTDFVSPHYGIFTLNDIELSLENVKID